MVRHFLSPVVTKAVAGFVVGCALLLLPAPGRAQTPAAPPSSGGALAQGFGEQGQIVISGDATLFFNKVNQGGWAFQIRPAADYFILPSVTLGAVFGYGIESDDDKGFLVGGRAGYNLNLTENVSVWARAGISYNNVSRTVANGGSYSTTMLNLSLPLMYHPAPHFFIALAPYYDLNFSGGDGLGFASVIGGWF
jgi:hypothetical protein